VLAGSGVTVNSFLPGPTRSEGVGDFPGKIAESEGRTIEDVEVGAWMKTVTDEESARQ